MITMNIRAGEKILFFRDELVVSIEAKGSSCMLNLKDGKSVPVDVNLEIIESQLTNTAMLRVHPDFIVNMDHVAGIPDHAGDGLLMENGTRIPITEKTASQLIRIIDNHINP